MSLYFIGRSLADRPGPQGTFTTFPPGDDEDGDACIALMYGDVMPPTITGLNVVHSESGFKIAWGIKGIDFTNGISFVNGSDYYVALLTLRGNIDGTCYFEVEREDYPDGNPSFDRFNLPQVTGLPPYRARCHMFIGGQVLATANLNDTAGGQGWASMLKEIISGTSNCGTSHFIDNAANSSSDNPGWVRADSSTQDSWSAKFINAAFVAAEPKGLDINSPVITF